MKGSAALLDISLSLVPYLSPLERERGLCVGKSECSQIFIKYAALIGNSVENKVVKMMVKRLPVNTGALST